MNDADIKKIMQILSTMDKKDLEKSLNQAKQVLNNKNSNDLLKDLNKRKDF